MSVIFAIKEEGKIVLAADKRGSGKDGRRITDDMEKIIVINDQLAFASAGNAVFGKLVEMDVDKLAEKETLTTDDLARIIRNAYQKIRDIGVLDKLNMPSSFYFLIAGKSQNGNASLISGGTPKGKLDMSEVPMALYPPDGTDIKHCCEIFAKNYKLHYADFVERTVREISAISHFVSPTGEQWIYDIATGKGTLKSF
jgi:hypothetical protein